MTHAPIPIICPTHGGLMSPFKEIIGEECPVCVFSERDRAVEELNRCRALLDSYGFLQTGVHNGISAMQNRILNLESMLKSYD